MITLSKDCLLFRLSNGEIVPFSADMISVELTGETTRWFDPEVATHAAKAVFHYFKIELGRQSVTAEEFSAAMERALQGLEPLSVSPREDLRSARIIESDLLRLAKESGDGCELLFFPRLRSELKEHLRQDARVLRYHGLKACVKQIAGAQRWNSRCRDLREQIVGFMRECAGAERSQGKVSLLVE